MHEFSETKNFISLFSVKNKDAQRRTQYIGRYSKYNKTKPYMHAKNAVVLTHRYGSKKYYS